jgi:hypothetical protein
MAFLKSTIFAATIACLATTTQIAHAEVMGNNDYMLSDDRVRSLDITPVLGRGYSRSTNKFLSTCLKSLTAAETTVPAFNFDHTFYDFTKSSDSAVLLAGPISQTFAFPWIKDHVNSVEKRATQGAKVYFFVSTMRIERYYTTVDESISTLSSEAEALLAKQDYVGFFKACGPSYVRGIRRAQELSAIFTFNSNSKTLAQNFAAGLKTTGSSVLNPSETTESKFTPIIDTLEIKILGYGLGLSDSNSETTETLVARSLDDYTKIVEYAYAIMTETSADSYVRDLGMVSGVEVIPWVDNVSFQVAVKLHNADIQVPKPRSLLSTAFLKSTVTDRTITFNNTAEARTIFRCRDTDQYIDMYGYCCEHSSMYDTSILRYNQTAETSNLTALVCRELYNLEKSVLKVNMDQNAEYISQLDLATRIKMNKLSTLEKCVSAVRQIPSYFDYNLLQQQESKAGGTFEAITVVELKAALDPFSDYSLVKEFGREIDEYMDMFYSPCVAQILGASIITGGTTDAKYIMASTWDNYETCKHMTCLDENQRWDRSVGGCAPSIISGQSLAKNYTTADYCAYDVDKSEDVEACKYETTELDAYHDKVMGCWERLLPATNNKIDEFLDYYCLPTLSENVVSDARKAEIDAAIVGNCTSA